MIKNKRKLITVDGNASKCVFIGLNDKFVMMNFVSSNHRRVLVHATDDIDVNYETVGCCGFYYSVIFGMLFTGRI